MHSSAFGAAALMVFRSFSSAARLSSLKAARYSSMVLGLVLGLASMGCAPCSINGWLSVDVGPSRVSVPQEAGRKGLRRLLCRHHLAFGMGASSNASSE